MHRTVITLFLLSIASCSGRESAPPPTAAPSVALPAGMSRVTDPSQVCMVNDQFMGRAQIAVVVDGRTYYGCCPDCKRKLEQLPETRIARDPVTGEDVDKANALMVYDASGKVLYFANEQTLQRYRG